mmetsp:Transcript_14553/g.20432  ORF Transcript_14553/g.20432 Transcript_14553/m.20432 type:complete len:333 (-) Transcript_14553:312-1310(-)
MDAPESNKPNSLPNANAGLPPGIVVPSPALSPDDRSEGDGKEVTEQIWGGNYASLPAQRSSELGRGGLNKGGASSSSRPNGRITGDGSPHVPQTIITSAPKSTFEEREGRVQRSAPDPSPVAGNAPRTFAIQTRAMGRVGIFRPNLNENQTARVGTMVGSINNFFNEELKWNTTIWDCLDDCNTCCAVSWCAPSQYAENLNIMSESKTGYRTGRMFFFFLQYTICWMCYIIWALNTIIAISYLGLNAIGYLVPLLCSCGCMSWLGLGFRSDIRDKYNLEEGIESDTCDHIFCHFCTVCQESRFLNIMYAANVERVRTYCDFKKTRNSANRQR